MNLSHKFVQYLIKQFQWWTHHCLAATCWLSDTLSVSRAKNARKTLSEIPFTERCVRKSHARAMKSHLPSQPDQPQVVTALKMHGRCTIGLTDVSDAQVVALSPRPISGVHRVMRLVGFRLLGRALQNGMANCSDGTIET